MFYNILICSRQHNLRQFGFNTARNTFQEQKRNPSISMSVSTFSSSAFTPCSESPQNIFSRKLPFVFPRQIPEVLFTLVNLARLNLGGTRMGPSQGEQLEASLRLDCLFVNTDAPPPPPPAPTGQEQTRHKNEAKISSSVYPHAEFEPVYGNKAINRSILVPERRLPEFRDQVNQVGHTVKVSPFVKHVIRWSATDHAFRLQSGILSSHSCTALNIRQYFFFFLLQYLHVFRIRTSATRTTLGTTLGT